MGLFKKVLFLVFAQIAVITLCLYLHLDDFTVENNLKNINSIIEVEKNKIINNSISSVIPKIKDSKKETKKESPKGFLEEKKNTVIVSDSMEHENIKKITPLKEKSKTKYIKKDVKPVAVISTVINEQINKKTDLKSDEEIQKEISNIILKNRIIFKRLSTDATAKSIKTIEKIANILKIHSHVNIEVGGYTDARGDDKVNAYISKHRALSVKKILINLGIDKNRLTAVGYGESHPIVKNDPQGYSIENRRVEFKIVKE